MNYIRVKTNGTHYTAPQWNYIIFRGLRCIKLEIERQRLADPQNKKLLKVEVKIEDVISEYDADVIFQICKSCINSCIIKYTGQTHDELEKDMKELKAYFKLYNAPESKMRLEPYSELVLKYIEINSNIDGNSCEKEFFEELNKIKNTVDLSV